MATIAFKLGRLLIFVLYLVPQTMAAQMIRPDVEVGMVCLDAKTGKPDWQHWFGRKLMFAGYQFSEDKVLVRIIRFEKPIGLNKDQDATNIPDAIFLDLKSGKISPPFSLPLPSEELALSNGWCSQGVTNIKWHNIGINEIGFLDEHSNLVWKITLPEGAYNLANWHDVLIYSQYVNERKQLVDHLFGQRAGEKKPSWEFILPKDIPSFGGMDGDVIFPTNYARTFTYKVGKDSIYVFGGGTLFALAPNTGDVLWRSTVSSDPVIKRMKSSNNYAEVVEAGEDLLLLSDQTLLRFSNASRHLISVLRNDVDLDSFHQNNPPVYLDGKIYCIIDRR